MERVQLWKWMTQYDMVKFSRRNGMQNVKAVPLNRNTSIAHEMERKNISFSSERLKTTEIYNICLIWKTYLESKSISKKCKDFLALKAETKI